MLKIFRRRKSTPEPEKGLESESEDQRVFAHSRIPDASDLSAHLRLEDGGAPIMVELLDMNIQGAGLRIPFHVAPAADHEHFVELVVAHAHDGWRVSSLARVTRVSRIDDAYVKVGLQFANLGDLYAQLDDALGRYFNRRSTTRLKPALEDVVPVRVSYKHHRLRGTAHDLSRTGVGVRMTLVQAATFKSGEQIKMRVDLPGTKRPLEVTAIVRHGHRIKADVVLGMEFDLETKAWAPADRRMYQDYLAAREKAILDFQMRLSRGA